MDAATTHHPHKQQRRTFILYSHPSPLILSQNQFSVFHPHQTKHRLEFYLIQSVYYKSLTRYSWVVQSVSTLGSLQSDNNNKELQIDIDCWWFPTIVLDSFFESLKLSVNYLSNFSIFLFFWTSILAYFYSKLSVTM